MERDKEARVLVWCALGCFAAVAFLVGWIAHALVLAR